MKTSFWYSCFYFFELLSYVQPRNFLGGSISWQYVSSNGTNNTTMNIKLQQTYSWMNSLWPCTATSGPTVDKLVCLSGCSLTATNIFVAGTCIYYDFGVGVTTSQNIQTLSYTLGARLVLAYRNTVWRTLVSGATTWSLTTYINLVKRNDSGQINSSPMTNITPIIIVPVNTRQTIRIPMTDKDSDIVKCRWANKTALVATNITDECAGVCQDLAGAVIYSSSNLDNNCTIVFNTSVVGNFVIAIQIEDFMPSAPNGTALSSIPLQFLISSVNISCGIPMIIGESLNGDTLYVQVNIAFSIAIIAQTGCNGTSIARFLTISIPSGVASVSSMIQLSSTLYSIKLTWKPSIDQLGTKHLFCTFAVDNNSSQSTEYCLNFIVISPIVPTAPASTSNGESINLYLLLGLILGIGIPFCILLNVLSYFCFPRYFNKKFMDRLRQKFSTKNKTLSSITEDQRTDQISIDKDSALYREQYIQPDDSLNESVVSIRSTSSMRFSYSSKSITPIDQTINTSMVQLPIVPSRMQGSVLIKAYKKQINIT